MKTSIKRWQVHWLVKVTIGVSLSEVNTVVTNKRQYMKFRPTPPSGNMVYQCDLSHYVQFSWQSDCYSDNVDCSPLKINTHLIVTSLTLNQMIKNERNNPISFVWIWNAIKATWLKSIIKDADPNITGIPTVDVMLFE